MSPTILELWQTEWCEDRAELVGSTGHQSIPVLVADGEVVAGEAVIVTYLNTHFAEPPEAEHQRAKAARMKRNELEKACLELATH
jgi:hypothetical protein